MANKREPYVEGHRIDTSVSTTVSDSRVNVYVGIEADTGTYDLTYQQTPKVFVQEYSTKAKPDTNDASTLLHAGKLVENFGIYVKRVNKDSLLPGIVSTNKYGEVGYFDTNYNLVKKLTQFSVTPKVNEVTKQKMAIVIDNTLYINSNITTAEELDASFDKAPEYVYLESSSAVSEAAKMSEAITESGITLEGAGVKKVTKTEGEGVTANTIFLFYVINVGDVYSVEDFLAKVATYAKNYRSDADSAEFIRYDAPSLMISIDISNRSDNLKFEPVQACKYLKNAIRLSKALTKVEFTEGESDESLLTNTKYYEEDEGNKYFDVGGFRYYPHIGDDSHNYADTTVTSCPSKFGIMDNPFTMSECTVSDGLLSSIDTMLTESDTVKPDSVYCSTDQVFKLHVRNEGIEGIVVVPSMTIPFVSEADTSGNTTLTESRYTEFFGKGFDSSLITLYVKDISGDWVEFTGETPVSSYYIDGSGYAYFKVKFDGQINDVSDVKAGISILYQTYDQEATETPTTINNILLVGKNISKADFIPDGYQLPKGYNIEVKNITSGTTDLGIICGLTHIVFGKEGYSFEKVIDMPTPDGIAINDSTGLSSSDSETIVVTATEFVEPSRIHKLYMYFLNNRNVTFGITGYNQRSWKKYGTVMQKNFAFESQDSVSAGIPGYHAVLINKVVYFNGTDIGDPTKGPVISEDWEYDNTIRVATIPMTARDFISELEGSLRNSFSYIAVLSDGSYLIGEDISISDKEMASTEEIQIIDRIPIDQNSNFSNARYAIIQRFTSAAKLFSINLTFDKTDNEIIRFVNSYNGTEYTDKISFNVGKIDGYGTNISYKSYNLFDGRSFFIKELNEEAPVIEMEVASFGDDIKPKKATSQDYVNALDDLITDEFKPSFLWDAGLCQTNYTNAMTKLAETTYSMVPISVPKDAESEAQIKAWKSAFNVDNPVQYILDGWHYNTVFGDISFECCPTYYYLVGKLSNANSITKEFQPMFYKTRGIVSAGVPVRNIPLTKTERENLLDLRINSIVRNKANSISYINQNFTNQQVESDFSEEQNVCISNEVCRAADSYADNNIISKNNTPNLRAQVTSELTNILRARILDSRGDDTAKSFYVECNDVNNPKAIIDARKLVIDIYVTYNKSINAVLVYSRTKSLDQG